MALARYEGVAQDNAGNVIANANVEARRDAPGRPVVPLFSDRNGTVPLGSSTKTDDRGQFFFHAPGGVYYIRVYTGPSQAPFQESIKRYVAIGTAAERDVEELASSLNAGIGIFGTLDGLDLFTPEAGNVGARVINDPDPANNGDYLYVTDTWVKQRGLPDTLARLTVINEDTVNDIDAEVAAGVDPANVVMMFIEPLHTNTGPVVINDKPLLSIAGDELITGQFVAGRSYLLTDEGDHYRLRNEADVSGIPSGIAAAGAEAVAAIEEAGEAALGNIEGQVETATTKAEETAADRVQTGIDAAAAVAAKTDAQTARDAALAGGTIYPDIASGRAAVADNAYFKVLGSGEVSFRLYQRLTSSTQTLVMEQPSATAISNKIGPSGELVQLLTNAGQAVASIVAETGASPLTSRVSEYVEHTGRRRFLLGIDPDDVFGQSAEFPGIADMKTDVSGTYVLDILGMDGKRYTPHASLLASDDAATPAFTAPPGMVVPDSMWSQWVFPLAVELVDGTQIRGSLARAKDTGSAKGRILIERRRNFDQPIRETIGSVISVAEGQTDDHDAPAAHVDPRPGSIRPLQVFQTDHARLSYFRRWVSTTLNPADLVEGATVATAGVCTYQQVLAKPDAPDTIWMLLRHSGGSADGNWSIYPASGNGATWTAQATLFSAPGLYMAWKPSADGSGLHLMAYGNPTASADHRIRSMFLGWDGVLKDRQGGTTIAANVFALSSFDPLASSGPIIVRTPALEYTRYSDMWEFAGDLHVVWAEFDEIGSDTTGSYWRGVVNQSTGAVTVTEVCDCGGKIDNTIDADYVAGAAILDANTIVAARWWGNYGDLVKVDVDAGLISVADVSPGKIARPVTYLVVAWDAGASKVTYALSPRIAYWRGGGLDDGYTDFYRFSADAVLLDTAMIGA